MENKCIRCGLYFAEKKHLKQHLKKKNICMAIEIDTDRIVQLEELSKKEGIKCEKCNGIYKNEESLRKHLSRYHLKKSDQSNKMIDEETVKKKEKWDIEPLSINNYELIYRIKDGYVDVTNLCKAGGKKYNDWYRLDKTKGFLEVLSGLAGIPANLLIQSIKDGKNEDRKTWVHPQVAINIAQWISPEFDVKVSKWIFELMTTGKVELGKEKTNYELETEYKKQITDMETVIEESKKNYKNLLYKHISTLKKHHYVKFNESDPCFYIIDSGIKCDCLHNKKQYKFGIAGTEQNSTIDERLSNHRTLWPGLKVLYLLFMKDVIMLEKIFKIMYENEINPNGHEILEGVDLEKIKERLKQLFDLLSLKEYSILDEEKLNEYNEYVNMTIKKIL